MCIGSVSNDHIHLLTYIGFVAKVKWVIMNENKVRKLEIALDKKILCRNKNLRNENRFLQV